MDAMPLRTELITGDFDRWKTAVVEVYRDTYRGDPYFVDESDVDEFAHVRWPSRIVEPGFRLSLVSTVTEIVGMAYGWTSTPSARWTQRIAEHLGADADHWLSDNFEFVDLAVRPAYQGMGAGKAIYESLFEHLPHRTALLYTLRADTAAFRMYLRLGWAILKDEVSLRSGKKYALMGRTLKR